MQNQIPVVCIIYDTKTAANFTEDNAGHAAVQACMQKAAIVNCYNTNKSAVIADASQNILNTDIIGITSNAGDTTMDAIYADYLKLTAAGKQIVINGMVNQSFADVDALMAQFAENVMVASIKNTDLMGGDHITGILVAAKAAATGNTLLADAVTEYLANSALHSRINTKLLALATCGNANELISGITTAISQAAQEAANENQPGGGLTPGAGTGYPGGAAGGSGGSGNTGGNAGSAEGNGTFADVPFDHWANADIMALYNLKVVSGYPDGSFKPNGIIKRQEGLKMICEAFDAYSTGIAINFSDVPNGAWFENYVKIGVENNIVKGVSDTLFGTDRSITRQDLAVMIYRLAGSPAVDATATFTDSADIAAYAADALNYMVSRGIMTGYPDGSIRPTKAITRAEAAKIINGCIKEGI